MSGGVRNLRAMFENQDTSTSPPADRGRSPAGSTGGASSGTSPRPMSKIRTSFVTVEKSGQMGLQLKRENSSDTMVLQQRPSFSTEDAERASAATEQKSTTASRSDAMKGSAIIEDMPDTAALNPTREGRQDPPKMGKLAPKAGNSTTNGHTKGDPKAAAKTTEKATRKGETKPSPITTAKSSAASKPSPTKASTPKTPTTPRGRGRPEASKDPEKKPSRASIAPSHSSKLPTKPVGHVAPQTRIGASPPQTGFVKPKPRSPTRPVKLPASLTAHTASSGSKTSGAVPAPTTSRQSLSRSSGNAPSASSNAARPASRSSTVGLNSSTSASRKINTLGHNSRPSLGPPPSNPKKQPSRQSMPAKAETPTDGSFVARMMRPTTSSASKTSAEQGSAVPPKKAEPSKKPVSHQDVPKARTLAKAATVPEPSKLAKGTVKPAKAAQKTLEKPKGSKVSENAKVPTVSEPKTVAPVILEPSSAKEDTEATKQAEIPVVEEPQVETAPAPEEQNAAREEQGDEGQAKSITEAVGEQVQHEDVSAEAREKPVGGEEAAMETTEEAAEDKDAEEGATEEAVEDEASEETAEELAEEEIPEEDTEEAVGETTEEPEEETHEDTTEETAESEKKLPIEHPDSEHKVVEFATSSKQDSAENAAVSGEISKEHTVVSEEGHEDKEEIATASETPADSTVPTLEPVEEHGNTKAAVPEKESLPEPSAFESALQTPTSSDPAKIPASIDTKLPVMEDPEDIKAREEIALLNAEVLKAAKAAELEEADGIE